MARRKRQLLDDSDSDSDSDAGEEGFDDGDPDSREERALFENPYKRQRRGKEDALYGVFGEDSEEEGFVKKKQATKPKRSDWAKAPAFVGGSSKVELGKNEDEAMPEQANEDEEDDVKADINSGNSSEDTDDADADDSRPASPRVRYDEDDEMDQHEERPRVGGVGAATKQDGGATGMASFNRGGIGSSSSSHLTDAAPVFSSGGGIGSSVASESAVPKRGGIGSSSQTYESSAPAPSRGGIGTSSRTTGIGASEMQEDLPSSFGGKPRTQRAFVREAAAPPRTATPLSSTEAAHFSKISGTFGARMLSKMGWQVGQGLGTTGEGIATPIESKLRPKGAGIAFRGFRERTEQAVAEDKRKGKIISDDEDDVKVRKGKAPAKGKDGGQRSDAWKRPKKVKTKTEHKTYEQIIAEAGEEPVQSGLGQIIDATGATPREISSLAEVSMASWTPSTDPTRIPEVRHNLRLIVDASKSELDGLAREAKALEERKKVIALEEVRLSKKVSEEAQLISRLQQVHLVADDINNRAKEVASTYEPSLDVFTPDFEKLLAQYTKEYERYQIDEIVVAAVAPVFRRMLSQWNPFEDPSAFTATFRMWRGLLRTTVEEKPQTQVDLYGTRTVSTAPIIIEKPMTPFESLMWNAWMPKIRSCINEWSAEEPGPLVSLFEAWSSLLPPFIRDNFFDQLVLPKVQKAVADWNPRKATVSLRTLVFPWLPHIGLRVEALLDDARRKVKSVIRAWTARDDIPSDLSNWKEVFDKTTWDGLMLKYIVPKLGAHLREDFRVNPRAQEMKPLEHILAWSTLLRPSLFAPILEAEFFPKWLDVLHFWLIQPNPSFEEIAQWYSFWKGSFPEPVQQMPGVAAGFTRGLQLMNEAIALGPDAPAKLPRPERRPGSPAPPTAAKAPATNIRHTTSRTQEITFRSIVEDYAAQHNLLFIPAGKVEENSRMPLFKVSQRADGKGGLLVYIEDDAVWAQDGDSYRAIGLDNMVLRAMKS